MILRRHKPEWRYEQGPGYHLRQYEGGRPTGLVAVVNHINATDARWIDGIGVRLLLERSRLVIEELRGQGTLVRIPRRSCVRAELSTEVGMPGSTLLKLTLTFRLGRDATVRLPLWFPTQGRASLLQQLVAEVNRSPTAAPDNSDWLVFRPVDTDDVVIAEERS
ncbi:MAG TPA: hypothetical protein VG247_21060 [Pseudonocardiaceae bacterium]|jgi:hypothetical protein|nr:hypothetical protein [Pseudonocardiaceae bacterium]